MPESFGYFFFSVREFVLLLWFCFPFGAWRDSKDRS